MNNQKGMKRFFADVKSYSPLLWNLTSKDFKVKYRRSVLGILWSVLNPLFTMLVITTMFRFLLRIDDPNFNYATYYITGWAIWNFFSESTSLSMGSVLAGASLIKKVYIPKYIFPVEKCLFALINMVLSLIAVIVVMLIEQSFPTWTALLFPIPVLYTFVFCLGFSLILSSLTVYFRDIMHLYGVLLTLWMYLTPIIYPMDTLTTAAENAALSNPDAFNWAGLAVKVVQCNPMYHFVEYFRDLMMNNTIPSLTDNLICIGIALGTLLIGCLVFTKLQKKFILHI